jgi:8-oxo-dGTP pyrophosphatase MutT (NUDIX family)
MYKGKLICKVGGGGKYIKFAGGGVDKGENPAKAVTRELKEEL